MIKPINNPIIISDITNRAYVTISGGIFGRYGEDTGKRIIVIKNERIILKFTGIKKNLPDFTTGQTPILLQFYYE